MDSRLDNKNKEETCHFVNLTDDLMLRVTNGEQND